MKYVVIFLIRLYQKIPGNFHSYCKYQPTCSEYMIGCLKEHGFFKGMSLGIKRIIKCNPRSMGGYDPIPLKEENNEKNK